MITHKMGHISSRYVPRTKKCLFARIEFDPVGADIIRPLLSKTGVIAKQGIENIAQIYSNVIVEDFVIM
ncbi:MAG: hypothetical protein LBG97_06340, partial [Coriobacteriales bacterium]|nr:hypothetical protein [Coriobacteriales bacterium]